MEILITIGGAYLLAIVAMFITTLLIKFDEEHSASKNSWHAKLFMLFYWNSTLPKTICSYFQLWVIIIFIWPILLPNFILNLIKRKMIFDTNNSVIVFLLYLYIIMSILAGALYIPKEGNYLLLYFIYGFLTSTGSIVISAGLIFGIKSIDDYYKEKRYNIKRTGGKPMLITRIKSWKDRNCPYINWTKQ